MSIDDGLLKDIRITKQLAKHSRDNAIKFTEEVRDVVIAFMDDEEDTKIGAFKIKHKHPWFLNNKYKNELEIKYNDRIILSWLKFKYDRWSNNSWKLINFDMVDIPNLKELLYELQAIMDIDLLEVRFDALKEQVDGN